MWQSASLLAPSQAHIHTLTNHQPAAASTLTHLDLAASCSGGESKGDQDSEEEEMWEDNFSEDNDDIPVGRMYDAVVHAIRQAVGRPCGSRDMIGAPLKRSDIPVGLVHIAVLNRSLFLSEPSVVIDFDAKIDAFKALSEAIDNASDGDTIGVCGSLTTESLCLGRPHGPAVRLIGNK